jgi:ABC-type Fe3+-hydroxamate transport system substrate-binding protein
MKKASVIIGFGLFAALALAVSSAQTSFPVTVKHDAGETSVAAEPKRFIALHPTSLEILLALGLQPVGVGGYGLMGAQPVGQPASTVPNFDDLLPTKPQHVGIESPSLEAMLALKPDLILSITFAAANVFPQFSKVAPTLVYNYSGAAAWQPALRQVGQLTGRSAKAEALIAGLERQARQARLKLASSLNSGNKIAVFALRGPTLLLTGQTFSPSRIFNQLGFKNVAPSSIAAFAPASPEVLLTLKADRAMLLNYNAPKDVLDNTVALLKRGSFKQVHRIDILSASRSGLGPLSDAQLIDAYTQAVLGAK